MARLVGNELPDDLLDYLRGNTVGRFKDVILVASLDENDYPHVAMLSHWEVYASDRKSIRLATYADSTTTRNLLRRQRVTMILVNKRVTFYVKGLATMLKARMANEPSNSLFGVKVRKVYEDVLPGARILTGMTFIKAPSVEPHDSLRSELVNG